MLSRVADSLYWMSRYIERAEHTARVVDVHLTSMLDQGPQSGATHQQLLLRSLGATMEDAPEDPYALARRLTFDPKTNSVVCSIVNARDNARQIREGISSEMYEQLNRLYLRTTDPNAQSEWNDSPHEFFVEVKEGAHLFTGVTEDTFSHGEAYGFIRVGKNLERAGAMVLLLRAHAESFQSEAGTAGNYLEWVGLLKSCTAFEAYCREYTADLSAERIVEFLLLEDALPRSVRFCVDNIQRDLNDIASYTGHTRDNQLSRVAGKLRATLDYADAKEVLDGDLSGFLNEIRGSLSQIHSALFGTYVRYNVGATMAL